MKKCADRKAFQRTSTGREIPGKHCLQGLNWTIDKISSSGNTKTTKKWYSQDFYRLIEEQVFCITCNSCLTIFFGLSGLRRFSKKALLRKGQKKEVRLPLEETLQGKTDCDCWIRETGMLRPVRPPRAGGPWQQAKAPSSIWRSLAISGGSSSICRIGPRGIRGTYRQI